MAGRDPDRLLVVEVNPNLPRTCSLAARVLQHPPPRPGRRGGRGRRRALHPAPRPQPDDIDEAIAELARSFIVDGATLQIGIGAVPNMVASELAVGTGGSLRDPRRDVHRRADAAPPGRQGDQRRQGRVQRGVDHHLRPRLRRALPWLDEQRPGGLRAGAGGQRPHRHRPEPRLRLDQRRPQRRPLRPGGGRQHRRQADLRRRRARGLRGRRRAAHRRPLADLPALDGGDQRRHPVADRRRCCPRDRWSPRPVTTPGWSSPSTARPTCPASPCASGPPPSPTSPIPTSGPTCGRRPHTLGRH